MSPVGVEDEESRDYVGGNGLHILPRLSESEAVHNFKEIESDRVQGRTKYRHVSHADFNKSQDHGTMGKKRRDITSEVGNAFEDSQHLMTNSNNDRSLQTPGFSTKPSKERYKKVKARHDLQL